MCWLVKMTRAATVTGRYYLSYIMKDMKTLLILRHAKSSWKEIGRSDHDRPLNKRGKRDAPRIGRWLRQQDLVPEMIICSTANRAKSTAEAVAEAMGYEGEIELTRSFYLADPETYIERCAQLPNHIERVMVVGHNYGVEELVYDLSGQHETMPTGATAYLTLPIDSWRDFSAETPATLHAVWRPKEIPIE